ncbi:hypothetical protein N7489_005325 [Penicillium chrysogenum]|jgi:hypothetical protein|uniref:Uncharacterized protein n=1 Tax=Penicillium chrysogenum TaxID=5076 RepID=A0ABQ8WSE6_PENCH|nr:uncharacterized protein N7489_005325 [Penicillium chrysogenum]KAJ5245229.1 hypothetical protein N7489_005325 [Penicillium chrysogenum]KAJ5274680.1 hypothetical protein N7505_003225 [Penicillium chrysogenum]KAJ5285169.1 hypothetical protein N7524_000475 [Penicillium chrysogenum]KAJ6156395.1 hypothetical protein N7497_005280 [Penicillium chrysogenum]
MIFKSTFLMAGALFMMGVRADCGTPVVTCETTDGSPDAKDVEDAMGYWRQIAGLGKDTCGDSGCAQPHGSGCHDSSVKSGTANIVLCQDDSSSSTAMCGDCNCIAGYLQAVIDQCENNGKIGGYAHVPMGSNYINYEFVHT